MPRALHSCLTIAVACASQLASAEASKPVLVIHQQYKSKDPGIWPQEWITFSELWKSTHPNWTWRFWNDTEGASLIEQELPEFKELYDLYSCHPSLVNIFRADLAGFAFVYLFGGIYADLDTFPHHSFQALLPLLETAQLGLFQLESTELEVDGQPPAWIPGADFDRNVIVAYAPGHAFVLECMRSIRDFVLRHRNRICGLYAKGQSSHADYLDSEVFYMLGADSRMDLCVNAYNGPDSAVIFNHSMVKEVEDATMLYINSGERGKGFGDFIRPFRRNFTRINSKSVNNVLAYANGDVVLFPAEESSPSASVRGNFLTSHYFHGHAGSWQSSARSSSISDL